MTPWLTWLVGAWLLIAQSFSALLITDGAGWQALGSLQFSAEGELVEPHEELDAAAARLRVAARAPGARVYVVVFTDPRGASSYNQRISQARAASVAAALMERDVPCGRIVAIGGGESRPPRTGTGYVKVELGARVVIELSPTTAKPPPLGEGATRVDLDCRRAR
jgi:hypothetical protein